MTTDPRTVIRDKVAEAVRLAVLRSTRTFEGHYAALAEAAIAAHLEALEQADRIETVEQLDALPRGSIVLTASPRLIPGMCLWIRQDSDKDGHWWSYQDDSSFLSKDLLYRDPEVVRVLYRPEETP